MAMNRATIRNQGARRRRVRRHGAAIVEFALVAPIFFLFLMASFEFGWLNVMRHTADNAAYEAARCAMVPGASAADATSKAQSILQAVGTRGAQISVTPGTITDDTEEVTVNIAVPVNRNALILPRFARGKTLHSSSTLRTERAEH
jgi:Flp pilus assembly protein TadG